MSRGPQNLRQSDLVKALKAMARAGVRGRVEIDQTTRNIAASNAPIMDHVIAQSKNTLDGVYRVFEYEVEPAVGGNGQIDQAEASGIRGKLDDSYGCVGLEYAKWLGVNHALVEREVEAFYKAIGQEMKTSNEERFWRVMAATLLMGAKYANMLKFTEIDESALKTFLIGVVKSMRGMKTRTPSDMKNKINVSNELAQFLNQMRARHSLRTNIIHRKAGKPQKGSINVVSDASRLDAIYVHIGVEDKVLRIASTYFSRWLEEEGHNRTIFQKALETEFGAKDTFARMGAGTQYAGAQERVIEIDLTKTTHVNFLDEV